MKRVEDNTLFNSIAAMNNTPHLKRSNAAKYAVPTILRDQRLVLRRDIVT
jgi:hypothetical protein